MSLTKSPSTLKFKVHRREPELIPPAKPTPHGFKPLSDLDDRDSLRFHVYGLQFYPYNPSMQGIDPVKMIRKAIAKTLVFYYPVAGRLREGPKRKLIVECTGEGILFIEADADVTLEQFGYPLAPPFPCSDELLYDVPGSNGILNCPLLLIQVTRLKCGGFIFGIRLSHNVFDAFGIIQFMSTIGEIARGAIAPSVLPTWERHIFNARNPPEVTCQHPEFNPLPGAKLLTSNHDPSLTYQGFLFGPTDISALRRSLPLHLRNCSTFEILTAFVWKCRVIALQPPPTEEMRLLFTFTVRGKLKPLVPPGYYGNAFVLRLATSTAKEISQNSLSFALDLIKKAKENVTEELVQSLADFLVTSERPGIPFNTWCYVVVDWTRAGPGEVDFGWGKPVYSGPTNHSPLLGFHSSFKTKNGENGVTVSFCMPPQEMKRFANEVNNMLQDATMLISAL